jgi:NADH-quinone oxidoreductase subunit L
MAAFHHNIALWVIGSVASIMTAFYMFRLLYLTFFNDFRGTEEQKHHLHESPGLITFPLIILATLAAVGGIISLPGNSWLNHYLAPLFGKPAEAHTLGTMEYTLMAVAVAGGLLGIGIAYAKYLRQKQLPPADVEISGFTKVVYQKYYVDEIYEALLVKPVLALSRFFRDTVETAISSLVYGIGRGANALGASGRTLQNGSLGLYLFVFVIGVCAIVSYLFLAQ